MHEGFLSFIASGRTLATSRNMEWEFSVDESGTTSNEWNLTQISGGRPPTHYLRDFGLDEKTLAVINADRLAQGQMPLPRIALSNAWQDLLKAATCDQLLFKRNSTGHVTQNVIRPLRVLATCIGSVEPWQLTGDMAREAISLAKRVQPSGKLADLVAGVIKTIIDTHHLAVACPLYPTLNASRLPSNTGRKSRAAKSTDELRDDLEARKRAERLPERRAFWELIRIIFTEAPASFSDALRFSALRTMVFTGLRLGEAVMIPADWMRYRDYYDANGRPAGESGGYSRALLLRHFAEKQQDEYSDSRVLFETTQCVPELFSELLTENLNEAARITQPLRNTLKRQLETGRLFPQYAPNDLVPVVELYPQITGNPFWLGMATDMAMDFVARYREGFDPLVLERLAAYQNKRYWSGTADRGSLDPAIYVYFNRFINSNAQHTDLMKLYHSTGAEYQLPRKNWSEVFLRIGELERYLAVAAPTKMPDWTPLKLENGELQPWELLYLTPKRALSEGRNDGITDISRYYSVGIPEEVLVSLAIGDIKDKRETLFMRYGQTDEDKQLTLNSHSLRHLQNSELFRLGIADTIITKRFNRRSVAQSYEYDHRSLSEELESIELPPDTEAALGAKASTVARLIMTGKAAGPIVTTFKKIQQEEGDEVAFEYLKAEADGFHATPYGHCINSFTVDPCPKNLECFAGCGHLTATDLPENRRYLENLEQRFQVALSTAQAKPVTTTGRANQITHATIRLESVRKLLTTPAGERPFPNGPDFSKLQNNRSVLDA